MQWLVVLDSVEGLNPKTDTSLALINQGRKSGLRVDTATIDKLFFSKQASVIAEDVSGAEHRRNLCDYDLILMRKEPPYDLAFHYATHLLSLSGTLVVNAPSALRDFNEKLITLPFHTYMPATLVSSSVDQIAQFFSDHDGGVIKALDSFQGKSVQRLTVSDRELIEQFTAGGTQPVMAQEFLDRFEGQAGFQKMRSIRMSQRVGRNFLAELQLARDQLDGSLHRGNAHRSFGDRSSLVVATLSGE